MSTTFLNLRRGGRLQGFIGVRMDDGHAYKFANDYTYIELMCSSIKSLTGETQEKAVRNQFLNLELPVCLATRNGYKALVSVNPELMQYATCPSLLLMDNEKSERVVIPAKFHRDLDVLGLTYLARIYLIG